LTFITSAAVIYSLWRGLYTCPQCTFLLQCRLEFHDNTGCRRETVRRAMPVKILSTAAKLYQKGKNRIWKGL